MSTQPLSRDSLARRNGGLWDYVSPSRLNTWLACPLKFKFKYVDGMRLSTSPAAFVGKAVHAGLETFYRHRQLGVKLAIEDVTRRMDENWQEETEAEGITFGSVAEELASREQAARLVKTYLEQLPCDEPRPLAVEVAAESPLVDPATGENLGIPLVGVMDLVLPDAVGPIIADFKTTSRGSEPLEIAHEIQLSCYAYLFRQSSAAREGGLEIRNLIKTKVPKVQFHRYGARTDNHFDRLFAVIRAYLDDLDSGRFLFRPGMGCAMCDFRGQCAARA